MGEHLPSSSITSISQAIDAVITEIPGSKSIANRALMCAALAEGRSEVLGVPDGDDSSAFVDGVQQLGAAVARWPGDGSSVVVEGTGGVLTAAAAPINARLAGTTSRFLTALAALAPGLSVIDGAAPLRARPMAPLHDALLALGAFVECAQGWGHLPVAVGRGALSGGRVSMPGDVSSQYLTALMLIAPYLPGGLSIDVTSDLVSRPYLEITRTVMADFGMSEVVIGDREISVGPGRYTARQYRVEPDASSASYPLAAVAVCGGRVTIEGLGSTSIQGDAAFSDVLDAMGCTVTKTETATTVECHGPLHGVTVDMADISDTAPTLAAIACFAESSTRITGIGFIRAKESDRIGDMVFELRRCGIAAFEEPDGMLIEPSTPRAARFETHHDHRLAMALALIGLRTPGIEIVEPGVVSKSWPGFWSMLHRLSPAGR